MAVMVDNERPINAERVTDALRRFVFAPGEEPTEVMGDPWAPVIRTDQGRYSVFGTNWLIRDDPAIDDAVLVVTEPGIHHVVCYGILLAHDGTGYLLNDPATLREFGRYLGRGLDPVAFAQLLAALHSYPSEDGSVTYPPDLGDLIADAPPQVRQDGATTVIEFRSTVRRVVEYEDVAIDTLAWQVEAEAGEPARWECRAVDRTSPA
jgi:hypothetical protein